MNHKPIAGAVLASLGLGAAFALAAAPARSAEGEAASAAPKTAAEWVARGKYVVNTAGCHDCHTPFKPGPNGAEPDMSRMLSGHPESLVMPPAPKLPAGPWLIVGAATNTAWSGPWGVSFTANLTPDAATGLGDWTLRDFMSTIRTGRHMGRGRAILPPMPIPVYNNFSDTDLEAIYRYLRTIPPIRNRVPEPWAPSGASGGPQQ
jgi:hypothetical protein